MRPRTVVASCLSVLVLSPGYGCRKSSPPSEPSGPPAPVAPRAAAGGGPEEAAARKAAADTVAGLEAKRFAGMNDAGQIIALYRKQFAGWSKANADACALWSALDAVDHGAFASKALRDAVLIRIGEESRAARPRELDSADDNIDIRAAVVAAIGVTDSFQCAGPESVAKHSVANDPTLENLRQMAESRGIKVGHASELVQDRIFFYTVVADRLEAVMKKRAPELVKKLAAEERTKHPYVLACDTRFLKSAAVEESYAVDGPAAANEDEDVEITDAMIIKVAERAARDAGAASAAGRRKAPAFHEFPGQLKGAARVCEGRLNETWDAPRPAAPVRASTVVWQEISTAGSGGVQDFWEARALVSLSDKVAGSDPHAAPWMLVLGVGFKNRWRLAAFPITPDRFRSFVARVTVSEEENIAADYHLPHDKMALWRVHARGVEVTCQPAPANVTAGEFPGSCE